MTLETGQVLQERYRIVSLLGEGGMGAVYRAWDTRLNVPVALKEMRPQPGLAARKLTELRRQFRREAQTMARLDHPHLVDVTDYFDEGGNVYLVMKFIDGESLANVLEEKGALSEAAVLRLARQLLDALAYCHDEGIIHRDVKPQNVIIRPDGQAVLVDFGLVKMWDPQDPRTRTAMRGMGTPEYAPPEQYDLDMGHTDVRSDIYSLGATLYHALTGEAPPTATTRIASRNAFQPPRALNRSISPKMEAAVLKAMQLTVDDRFQNAEAMRSGLIEGIPTAQHTRVMGGRSRGTGSRERNGGFPWIWALGGGAALVALGVAAVLIWPLGAAETTATTTPEQTATSPPATATAVPATSTLKPTASATNAPTLTPSRTPTRVPTSTPVSIAASETPAPTATNTPPAPSPTPAAGPTATAAPSATEPQLLAPAQGQTYKSPITFQWQGSLGRGQAYRVTARHASGSSVVQSQSLSGSSWSADLPAEHPGDWRWTVSVVEGDSTVATSSEGMFWFDPDVGGGGGGGGEDGDDTPTPKPTPQE